MTEPETMPETFILFQGREIWVRFPQPEQIMVWNRTVKNLAQADEKTDWTAPEVMKALERCRAIVDSLIVNQVDVEWLDDEMLAGRMSLTILAPFITQVLEKFQGMAAATGTREERRAAKKTAPPKKARRKAPTAS